LTKAILTSSSPIPGVIKNRNWETMEVESHT